MHILFAGASDWANVSNRIARSINAVAGEGVARVLTLNGPHPFGYDEDRLSRDDAMEMAPKTDWLISTGDGSYDHLLLTLQGLPFPDSLRLATAHVGSAYREAPAEFDNADDLFDFEIRFLGGDLFRFAADDPRAVPYFAPPHSIPEKIVDSKTPPRISHSPSARDKKGTDTIAELLDGLDVEILENLPFDECASRRAKTHIFIDQLNDLGGYGAAAAEAMAAGCATLGSTANIHPKVWTFYGRPPIVEVTRDSLRSTVERLLNDPAELEGIRHASREWALRVATPKAVGRYWLDQLSA